MAVQLQEGQEDIAYILKETELLQGYTDVDGDELSVSDLTADNGILTDMQNGTWEFVPNSNYNGIISINYFVDDGQGMKVFANNSFVLAAINDAPILSDDSYQLPPGREDNSYIITKLQLLTGFSDVDQDELSIQNLSIDQGSIQPINGNEWEIQTELNFFGQINLSYQVSDGRLSIEAEKSVQIASVNDEPVATFDAQQFAYEDENILSGVLTSTDPDPEDTLVYSEFGTPIEGLTINSDGTWSFDATGDSYQSWLRNS